MEVVDRWTGRHANALRTALRKSNEEFAHVLGTGVRTVANWNKDPHLVPYTELQRALDTALKRASPEEQARFALLINGDPNEEPEAPNQRPGQDDRGSITRLAHDPTISDALRWLDTGARWPTGDARHRVQRALDSLTLDELESRAHRRAGISREQQADALVTYYGSRSPGTYRFYTARCEGQRFTTTIVTRPEWLDLGMPLGRGIDELTFTGETTDWTDKLSEAGAEAAIRRIAETIAIGTRMINAPLYRLTDIAMSRNGLSGSVRLTQFINYALTLDLLENELIDALSEREVAGSLPLRDSYLPEFSTLVELDKRLCVGGPLALLAVARSRRQRRGKQPDYMLLIQERSGRVLNAARRLAVIPKGFHGPLVDFSDDAQISATIERELEEELFGRPEVDITVGAQLHADPMHRSSLSAPMQWLVDRTESEAWRMECVGFGINAMTGNYEIASLIVIDDEAWWEAYGGLVQANWETEGLRRYSSLDRDALSNLIHDPAWSNEGLFALSQALRRLNTVGNGRVNLPTIELEFKSG